MMGQQAKEFKNFRRHPSRARRQMDRNMVLPIYCEVASSHSRNLSEQSFRLPASDVYARVAARKEAALGDLRVCSHFRNQLKKP